MHTQTHAYRRTHSHANTHTHPDTHIHTRTHPQFLEPSTAVQYVPRVSAVASDLAANLPLNAKGQVEDLMDVTTSYATEALMAVTLGKR